MFSLRFTVLLLAFLLGAYLLKLMGLEPYPAIIMPSGHYKAEIGESQKEIGYTSLYGINQDEKWSEVDLAKLFHPMPLQYSGIILHSYFGLKDESHKNATGLKRLFLEMNIKRSHKLTEEEKKEVKQWLKERLQNQGFIGSSLKIVKRSKLISVPAGDVLNDKIGNEEFLYLD